jgi:hypothetical protein
MDKKVMGEQFSFWMPLDLAHQVRAKALREAVNLSALLRGFLRDWIAGTWTPLETQEEDEPPAAPQEG